jgi:hypothetical protein
MRFNLLVLCIPLMSASAAQAQDLRAIATVPNSPGKIAGLPSMPKPKSPPEDCGLSRSACFRSADPINPPAHPYATWGRERVADKKFWAIAAATMGTSVLAAAATSHCRATVGVENCAGHYGSFKGMQGIQLGVNGFLTGLGYFWKKSEEQSHDRHPQWWVIPVGMTAFNTYRIATQYQKRCRPGTNFNGESCN